MGVEVQQLDRALRHLLQKAGSTVGEDFLSSIVVDLAEVLRASYVYVAALDDRRERARTVAMWSKTGTAPPLDYSLRGTPCEGVTSGLACVYNTGVRAAFPKDELLLRFAVDGYVGVPLVDTRNHVIGILVAMYEGRVANPETAATLLDLFAARVAAELQRVREGRALQQAHDALARQIRLEEFALAISTTLLQERGPALFDAICAAVQNIGEFAGAQEAYLVRVEDDRLVIRAHWGTGSLEKAPEAIHKHPQDKQAVLLGSSEVPESEARRGVKRMLAVPLPGVTGGALVLASTEAEAFLDGMVFVRLTAQIIATALQRLDVEVAEDRLRIRLNQAQRLEAVGQLAGGVAHDFNNLLVSVLGNADLLLSDLASAPLHVREAVKEVRAAAERGAGLTEQLLSFSQRKRAERMPVDVNEQTRRLLSLIRRTLPKTVEITFDAEPQTGNTLIDPGQFDQVLLNLAINASDAMPAGGDLVISTRRVTLPDGHDLGPDLSPGTYVLVSVADTGTGMDADTVQRIFEPFFTTKSPGKGTGLGLASVYGIVARHKGTIQVKTSPGDGARFEIYLPAARSKAQDQDRSERRAVTGGRERILLAEDDDGARRVTQRILDRAGYRVTAVSSGREALAALRAERFDLAILDVIMPDGTGADVYSALRRDWPDMQVLFASGYTPENFAPELLIKPHCSFISKPFDSSALLGAVRGLLEVAA